jgi:sialate O-acetylesterase
MVQDWRVNFKQTLPFMWMQLSPWVGHEAATSFYQLPAIRQAQLTVTTLDHTGFASAVDLGDPDPSTNTWGGVHWRTKQPAALRFAAVARHLVYGSAEQYQGPAAASATQAAGAAKVTVTFASETVSPGLVLKPMVCPFFALNQPSNVERCGWLETRTATGNWTNTTFAIGTGGSTLDVDASAGTVEVRYLYADWPVATVFNAAGFPATPFVLNVTVGR